MRVTVATGSRLHLGFTNLSEDLGRCYGSLGVALDRPSATVVIEEGDGTDVEGEDPEQLRAWKRRFCEHFRVDPRVAISVRESIPQHVGLGSGTQLALAIGLGLAAATGLEVRTREVAVAMGRGRRSGIGVAAFQAGGFVVDAGHPVGASGPAAAPTLVWRRDFPSDWCFVVAVPEVARGFSGRSEEGIFEALAPSVRISEEICRITQLLLLPALVEHDIERFGRALTAIDRKTGGYFADVQHGLYSDGAASQTIDAMLRAGAFGAGQSSWGPAVYGLVETSGAARLEEAVRTFFSREGTGGSVFVGRGRNTEARVEVERGAS
jgi:beta-ribofuranosylaminobenzene 5'-phosphate synthase